MPKLLTRRKEKWASHYKPDYLRGTVLSPSIGIADRYYSSLASLVHQMTEHTNKQIARLFNSDIADDFFDAEDADIGTFAQDKSLTVVARILTNALLRKFEKIFATSSYRIASSFANQSDKSSSTALHSSLQKLSGGLSLPTTSLKGPLTDILNASIEENVSLIKSIPQKYLFGVQQAVMRSITTGNGMQTLVPYLQKHKGITLGRARMIARDQTAKAFNTLNKARMQSIGLEEYKWLHIPSNHPRKLHEQMSGNVYRFDDPPVIDRDTGERGIPGQLINCHCKMQPIIRFKGE